MKKGNKFLEITLCLMMMLLLVGCENKKVITFSLHICTKEKGDVIIKKNRKVKKSESDSNNRKTIYSNIKNKR